MKIMEGEEEEEEEESVCGGGGGSGCVSFRSQGGVYTFFLNAATLLW